jgi:hypothetical protein
MLYRKYGIPVVQYVVYIGKGKATMPTKMDYSLYSIHAITCIAKIYKKDRIFNNIYRQSNH